MKRRLLLLGVDAEIITPSLRGESRQISRLDQHHAYSLIFRRSNNFGQDWQNNGDRRIEAFSPPAGS